MKNQASIRWHVLLSISLLATFALAQSNLPVASNPMLGQSMNDTPEGSLTFDLEGLVLSPEGAPAQGAVVVTSVGGQAVTNAAGEYRLEVRVPVGANSLQVTAVGRSGANLVVSQRVALPATSGRAWVSPIHLTQSSTCAPSWLPTFGPQAGMNNDVDTLAVFDDGNGPALYAGGIFTIAGGTLAVGIARWDGSNWSAVGNSAGIDVQAMTSFDDGTGEALYVGGHFTSVGGVPANNIAKWDGTSWTSLGSGMLGGPSATVYSLAAFDDGNGEALFAGGIFTSAGGVSASRIAKWDGTSWASLGSGIDANGIVRALAVYDDGGGANLIAGGLFFTAGGVSANCIAKWNGSNWKRLGGGVNNEVRALTVYDEGNGPALIAGGFFTAAWGQSANRIASWDGTAWTALGSGMTGGKVYTLAVFDDGNGPALYAGGDFDAADGVAAEKIAKWDGLSWTPLGGGFPGSTNVDALVSFDDGNGAMLYAGGDFTGVEDISASFLAKWDGSSWWIVGDPSIGCCVSTLTVFDDGTGPALYVGGIFNSLSGLPLDRIAKWNGSSWVPLGGGMDGMVHDLTVFDDGSGRALYAGGAFTTSGGVVTNHIAKWDGLSWTAVGSGMDDSVQTLAVYDDGGGEALYAGGFFEFAGGTSANRVAKWNGASWAPLGEGLTNISSTICWAAALEVFDDGNGPALYAGGYFTDADRLPANHIAKWDGSSWTALGSGTNARVDTLLAFDDGGGAALYVGGGFTSAGGGPANYIAVWNGSSWATLGSGMSGFVISLTSFEDGSGAKLYAGGSFYLASGAPVSHIAQWDGSSWAPLGAGVSGTVYAFQAFDDGGGEALFIGGSFMSAYDSGDSFMAKWGCPGANNGSAYCFGDGSGAVCPCGASGNAGAGCANTGGVGGARLDAAGSASLTNDSFELHISGVPGNRPGLILRGANQVNGGLGNPVGDGLLCATGQSARSQVQITSSGNTAYVDFRGSPFGSSSYGPGLSTNYQFWYRDPSNTCSGQGFNFTNAWTVQWLP